MQMEIDPSLESGNTETHVPIPFLIGTNGWGLFVESKRPGVFNVANSEDDLIEITYGTAEDSPSGIVFHLLAADHPLDIPRLYYQITGFPALPAPWALGPWVWRDETLGQAQVEDDIRMLRALDLATSALWIDRPYASAVQTFDFDASRFPDPRGMVDFAHNHGLRVALWHAPYLETKASPYREQADTLGYFPPETGLLLNKWSKPIDFTNPEAYAFWQSLVAQYMDIGIEGFKLDYGEDVTVGVLGTRTRWLFADGTDERTGHYAYQLLYHRAYAELMGEDGGFLLCRTGRWGDQRFVRVIWPGDRDASFTHLGEPLLGRDGTEVVGVGGLPATMIIGLNLGVSGFPFYGADTGGYLHSPPDNELYVRWVQQTALSSVMQIGDSSSQMVWEFNPENGRDIATLDIYRQYTRLHLRLFPYEWTLAQRMLTDGRPIQIPPGLAYPQSGVHPWDEYLFGEDLLVAPVVTRGATSRTVFFPPGQWIDYWDGTVFEIPEGGQYIEVTAPLEKLPLFLRAGGILPLLRPTIDTLAPATVPDIESYANDPGILYVRIFPGPSTQFVVFDATSIAQEPGKVRVSPGNVFAQGFMLEIVGTQRPHRVTLDGQELTEGGSGPEGLTTPGWAWDASVGGTLWVRLPEGGGTVEYR